MTLFERTNIRLPAPRYVGRQSYFVTMCFHDRRRYGANARIARWIIRRLRTHAEACGFLVYAYCVMPDHIHFLAVGALETSNLIKLVEAFKQDTAIEFSRKTGRPLWQTKYYDHILRGNDSVDRVAWYIWLNPLRNGLCRAPADYPFSGAMTPAMQALFRGSAAVAWLPPWKTATPKTQTKTENQNLPG